MSGIVSRRTAAHRRRTYRAADRHRRGGWSVGFGGGGWSAGGRRTAAFPAAAARRAAAAPRGTGDDGSTRGLPQRDRGGVRGGAGAHPRAAGLRPRGGIVRLCVRPHCSGAAAADAVRRPGRFSCSPCFPPGGSFSFSSSSVAVLLGALVLRAGARVRSPRARGGVRPAIARRWCSFRVLGLAQAPTRNGVLLYVSLAERYARIVADVGLAAAVSDALARGGRGAGGRFAGGRRRGGAGRPPPRACGDLLAPDSRRFPGVRPREVKRFHSVVMADAA